MPEAYDLFFSYAREADASRAAPLIEALRADGLTVFVDESEIDDFASITQRIRTSLAASKALVAFYSTTYPARRACEFELTAAFLAGQALGDPRERVLVVNPESHGDHIHPIELRDARQILLNSENLSADDAAARIARHVSTLDGYLGTAIAPRPPPVYGAKLVGSTRFVGRQQVMWEIHSALHPDEGALLGTKSSVAAQVVGLAGIGKTLLVEEYALRFARAYPGGVFVLRAASDEAEVEARATDRHDQFKLVATDYGIDVDQLTDQRAIERALRTAIHDIGEPCLWLVDDLPTGLDASEVKAWFAPDPAAHTLITTRSAAYGALASTVKPDVLEEASAYRLLTRERLPSSSIERVEAAALVEDLGRHALAIDVAAAALRNYPDLAYSTFRSELADPSADVLEFAAQLADELPTGHEPNITATLLRSVRTVDATALDVLRIARILAAAPIPIELIRAALSRGAEGDAPTQRVASAIAALARDSLAETVDGAVSVHQLVSRITAYMTDGSPDRAGELRTALVDHLSSTLDSADDIRQHASLAPLIPHLRALTAAGRGASGDLGEPRLAERLMHYDYASGSYETASRLAQQVVDICRRVLGDEDPKTLSALGNLAVMLGATGRRDMARGIHEEVAATHRRVLGDEHPDTLSSLDNLAASLAEMGDYAKARSIQQAVVATRQRVLGDEHPGTLTSLSNLGLTLASMGEYDTARNIQEAVVATRRRVLGDEHPDTLRSLSNFARTLAPMGEIAEARSIQEPLVEAFRRVLGDEHPDTLTSFNNLASTLSAMGEYSEARRIQEPVAATYRRVLGDDHPDTLSSLNNFGLTVALMGDYDEARSIYQYVAVTRRRVLGDEHPDTLSSLNNLGMTVAAMGDYDEARSIYQHVAVTRRRVLGDEHPDTLGSLNNLGLTLASMGEVAEARSIQEPLVEAFRRVLGDDHPDTLTGLSTLAAILGEMEEYAEALKIQKQVAATRRRVLGDEHPDTLSSLDILGLMLASTGEDAEALRIQEQVTATRRRVLGDEHPVTL